jgi:hypothetical protein
VRCLVLISVLACLGCGPTLDFTPTQAAPRALRALPVDQVEVFTTSKPARPHLEVGQIKSQQEPGGVDQPADLIAKMRALAAQHGCDGLIITGRNDSVTETMLAPGGGTRVYTLNGFRASCIVYVGAAPSVQAAALVPTATAACVPGVTQLCFGTAGCRGGQSCAADGRSWTHCDCGSESPPIASEH